MPGPRFRSFEPAADDAAIIDLLTTETWPHRVKTVLTPADVQRELDGGHYFGETVLTFLIETGDGDVVGYVRASDCADGASDPQLDFRLRECARGQGIGKAALAHITQVIFERWPQISRIEGQTRQDNIAMRRAFLSGGYVQEAVYRRAWPAGEELKLDGIGYAILREDWESGTTTTVDWSPPDAV